MTESFYSGRKSNNPYRYRQRGNRIFVIDIAKRLQEYFILIPVYVCFNGKKIALPKLITFMNKVNQASFTQ